MNRFALVTIPVASLALTACYPYYHKETRVPEISEGRPRGKALARPDAHAALLTQAANPLFSYLRAC